MTQCMEITFTHFSCSSCISQVNGILAALDATKHPDVAKRFEVKGYPTMKYFKKGELIWDVSRDLREADALVRFMKNPTEPAPPPPPEPEWEEEPSEVIHLNIDTFKSTLKKKKHSLVMFYAPCKFRINLGEKSNEPFHVTRCHRSASSLVEEAEYISMTSTVQIR